MIQGLAPDDLEAYELIDDLGEDEDTELTEGVGPAAGEREQKYT